MVMISVTSTSKFSLRGLGLFFASIQPEDDRFNEAPWYNKN